MEEFLKFGRFKRECVKIQGGHGPSVPTLADVHGLELDLCVKEDGLKDLGNLILQLAFTCRQFISFNWLQKDTQFDPNGAKMSTVFFFFSYQTTITSVCDWCE